VSVVALGPADWGNLGLWASPDQTYVSACEALADRLAEAARLTPGCSVADVGCGRGAQLARWVRTFGVERVEAFDTAHGSAAQKLVMRCGLAASVAVHDGGLERLEAASVDRVVALDSAYFFDTRREFVQEAARVLKPGGRLGLADLVVSKPGHRRLKWAARISGVPTANLWTAADFGRELADAGFTDLRWETVTRQVLGGFAAAVKAQGRAVAPAEPWVKVWATGKMCRVAVESQVLEYVLAGAARS